MGLVLGPAKTCCNMKHCGAAVGLGGDYKSPAPSVCSIERGSNGGLGLFEWAQSGKPCVGGKLGNKRTKQTTLFLGIQQDMVVLVLWLGDYFRNFHGG